MKPEPGGSGLDRVIAAEIIGDRFHRVIEAVAATPGVREILEIGSSSGDGSTVAFVAGALRNPVRPRVHCMELSGPRFAALSERYSGVDFVHCYRVSSVPLESFPSEEEVTRFHSSVRSRFSRNRLEKVLGWLRQDREYVVAHGLSRHGIREIRESRGIEMFDAVLIDGSEFTGKAELDEVYGARFLLLDDILSYKNWENCRRLEADRGYRRISRSRWLRNGFAVFERSA